jgi:hydrogenase expression/formation protein HypD
MIPKSALALKEEFAAHDATIIHNKVLALTPEVEAEAAGCKCGEVLRGLIRSEDCPMFGTACKPTSPRGPCMVSAEGNCSIAYRFSERGRK